MMELVYIYIKEFRNIKNTGINLSNKFTITFEEDDKEFKLDIKKNENVQNIYPENILNVNVFLRFFYFFIQLIIQYNIYI